MNAKNILLKNVDSGADVTEFRFASTTSQRRDL